MSSAGAMEIISEAKENNYTNIYLNYQNLSELPAELLTLTEARKLFLKRNVLKKLVSLRFFRRL